jgi:hypothetical protein
MRAERRAGELLKELARGDPGRPEKAATVAANSPSPYQGALESSGINERTDLPAATIAGGSEYRQALDSSGINERTARRYQELANVPKEEFESAPSFY